MAATTIDVFMVGSARSDANIVREALRRVGFSAKVLWRPIDRALVALRAEYAGSAPGQVLLCIDERAEGASELVESLAIDADLVGIPAFIVAESGVLLRAHAGFVVHFTPDSRFDEAIKELANTLRAHRDRAARELSSRARAAALSSAQQLDKEESEALVGDLIDRVRKTARNVCRSMPEAVRADVESAAMIGMMEALQHVEQMSPEHFEGYLKTRVCGAIRDEARRFDPLTRSARRLARQVERTTEELRVEYGHEPELDEVAAKLGVDEDKCWEVLELSEYHVLPIDDDTIPSPANTAEERFIESYAAAVLRWALGKLDKRSRLVLRLWYKRGLPIATIAQRLNVSIGRVHQIRVEAEGKLAALFRSSPPITQVRGARTPADWEEHTSDTLRAGQALPSLSLSRSDPIRYALRRRRREHELH